MSSAPAAACTALPEAMRAEAKSDPSIVKFAARLPIQIPGHSRFPASNSPASAIPDAGQTGVAYPGGMATRSASFAAAK